jgi:hypothetical protein
MNNYQSMQLKISNTCALLLIFLMLYASISKIFEYNIFIQQLSLSPFFAIGHTKTVAFLVLSLEMIIAVLFLIPRAQNIAFLSSLCLLTSFTVYIHIIQYSEFIPCSCGGILGKLSWNDHIIFNIFFIIISFFGYYFNDSKITS